MAKHRVTESVVLALDLADTETTAVLLEALRESARVADWMPGEERRARIARHLVTSIENQIGADTVVTLETADQSVEI